MVRTLTVQTRLSRSITCSLWSAKRYVSNFSRMVGSRGFFFLVLVEHPFERGAGAENIVPGCGRNARQLGLAVERDDAAFLIGAEHRLAGLWTAIDPIERPRVGALKPDVQIQKLLADAGPLAEVVVEGEAGQLLHKIRGVIVAVDRVMQYGVGVGEDSFR